MPHRRRPRRNRIEQQLITRQQQLEGPGDNVIPFETPTRVPRGNIVRRMTDEHRVELETMIRERFDSARDDTDRAAAEIERAERQFDALYPEWEGLSEPPEDDDRIFMRKTMEHLQLVFSHLDSLTSQLDPLLRFRPKPSGLWPVAEEFERAKVKEILVDNYFRDVRLKKDVLPRWRWNFLKHPSAFLRVLYETSETGPDIQIELIDRANLFIDPWLKKGDIKHAGWVIERDWVSLDEVDEMARQGWWHVPEDATEVRHLAGFPTDDVAKRLLGHNISTADSMGPDRDNLITVFYYWQAAKKGQAHAHGVVLGGRNGRLVRWGPNPQPYKGIPYRGKSYLRHPYKVDGHSLAYQYRSVQEVYNTFLDLRIKDVLDGVKRQHITFANLFNEMSQRDHAENQQFIRANPEFMQPMIENGRKLTDFFAPLGSGDSSQHLLRDLEYFVGEGKEQTNIQDVFRGQNPQSGATLGQFQEQLQRSLGVFRPIFSQEMALIEELGEIVNAYFQDEDFFGPERVATIIGPNRYRSALRGFFEDETTGMAVRPVTYDEMDVDVTVDAVSQAEHIASRTLRNQGRAQFFDSLRHHPELVREAGREIDFNAMLLRQLQDMGEDIESIRLTPEEKQKRAQQEEQQRQQQMQEQVGLLRAEADAKGRERVIGERARTQGRLAEIQTEARLDTASDIQRTLVEISAQHQAKLEEMQAEFINEIRRMREEARLESQSQEVDVGHGNNINR